MYNQKSIAIDAPSPCRTTFHDELRGNLSCLRERLAGINQKLTEIAGYTECPVAEKTKEPSCLIEDVSLRFYAIEVLLGEIEEKTARLV